MDPSSPCPPSRRRRATPDSMGPPSSPSQRSTRSQKAPSITPRRFNRFFAPRSAQQGPQTARASRTALGDASLSAGNRRLAHSSPIKQSERLLDGDENGYSDFLDATPERPSPLKRVCNIHPRDLPAEIESLNNQEIPSSPPACPSTPNTYCSPPKPLKKSTFRKTYGSIARREVDWSSSSFKSTRAGICSSNMQSETAHFYSHAEDFHQTYNFDYDGTPRSDRHTNPFCFIPCNTNSLAAIGDEEGYVRLVETKKGSSPPLFKDYLHFRAHKNAILNLEFSEDDALLATCSGDQTSQVIDMKTQKALYTLWGHRASLRQVKFQPGSGGKVLATAGRDGLVMIWDLRCTPAQRPAPSAPVRSLAGTITTLDAEKDRKYAQHVKQFMPPMPRNSNGKSPNEKSVTALSFISSSNPYYLLSGSATGPNLSLWDMRKLRMSSLSGHSALVGRASPSQSVKGTRGLLSMALSADKSRIYALSRDSTAYVYSTAQLLNGNSQVEALYGFRHKDMIVTTWYHNLALRHAKHDKTELLAVGGVGGRAVLFPTNEDYMHSGLAQSTVNKTGVRIYDHGTVLSNGHEAEIASVAWSYDGELCTAADDWRCRVWREDAQEARAMRAGAKVNDGEKDVHYCGWADVPEEFDADDY